jgi:AMMECR1 domain-containing protein
MNLQSYVIANILNQKQSQMRTPNLSTIPKNAFGVFCTIRRSQKLPTYPEDIHGCIGYWSSDYSIVPPTKLLQHLIDVGRSAMYKDERRTYFPSIETDSNAIIEIDFMLLPTIPINPVSGQLENGDQFANSKYGLIVSDNNNMSRATFLPHVFPDTISWQDIKGKVISKAGATTSNTNNKFLAYQIKQVKGKLFNTKSIKRTKSKTIRKKK